MKLNKIASLCKSRKTFRLYDKPEKDDTVVQWLGDGFAMYQINGLPCLDKENIFTWFDIPQARQSKYFFQHTSITQEINLNDLDPSERILEDSRIAVMYDDTTLLPLRSENGILFIQKKYLSPLEDVRDSILMFERRTPQGQPYIAVKAGFMIQAVIFPYDLIKESFVRDLDNLSACCRQAFMELENKRQSGDVQESFFETAPEA